MAEPKEVYFDQYCSTCKYSDLSEYQDPCWDCMEKPMNYDSHKPYFWKEGKSASSKSKKNANRTRPNDRKMR